MPHPRVIALAIGIIAAWSGTAVGQVTFQPSGCEFRVWFVTPPKISTATIPAAEGKTFQTSIAELNLRLDDGNAHYFRAECTQIAVGRKSHTDLIEDMTELARMNLLEDVKVWVEELPNSQPVGRIRARVNSGQRTYFFDIRRYIGETNIFDAWAGAERFPTEGITMFFKSVNYRGRPLNN